MKKLMFVYHVTNQYLIALPLGTCFPSGQKAGRPVSQGRRRQECRHSCLAATRKARGGAGGSTGDSEPWPAGLSSAEGGRYTCVHAPAVTGQPPASTSSGSGDQQLSDSQHPTTTVTTPINNASTMYTSAFPSCFRMPNGCRLRHSELMRVGSPRVRQSRYPRPLVY